MDDDYHDDDEDNDEDDDEDDVDSSLIFSEQTLKDCSGASRATWLRKNDIEKFPTFWISFAHCVLLGLEGPLSW